MFPPARSAPRASPSSASKCWREGPASQLAVLTGGRVSHSWLGRGGAHQQAGTAGDQRLSGPRDGSGAGQSGDFQSIFMTEKNPVPKLL